MNRSGRFRMRFKILPFLAAIICLTTFHQGKSQTGVAFNLNQLIGSCRIAKVTLEQLERSIGPEWEDLAKATSCIHFLQGFVAGYYHGSEGFKHRREICIPDNAASHTQLVAVFLDWADRNPKYWHLAPINAVFVALAAAFPCRR